MVIQWEQQFERPVVRAGPGYGRWRVGGVSCTGRQAGRCEPRLVDSRPTPAATAGMVTASLCSPVAAENEKLPYE